MSVSLSYVMCHSVSWLRLQRHAACLVYIQYVWVSMMNGMACSGHPLNIALGDADLDTP